MEMFLKLGMRLRCCFVYAGHCDGSHQPSSGPWLCNHEKDADPLSYQSTRKSCQLCWINAWGLATGKCSISPKRHVSGWFFFKEIEMEYCSGPLLVFLEAYRTLLLGWSLPEKPSSLVLLPERTPSVCPESFQPIFSSRCCTQSLFPCCGINKYKIN